MFGVVWRGAILSMVFRARYGRSQRRFFCSAENWLRRPLRPYFSDDEIEHVVVAALASSTENDSMHVKRSSGLMLHIPIEN